MGWSANRRLIPLSHLHGPTHPFVRLVSLGSRFLLNKWCASVEINGVERLLKVLNDQERLNRRQGVLTYANHISVLDDPTIFGSIPKEYFRRSMTTRWTLGASDIMFTNAPNSYIFRSGQVLPTDRGRGVFQPALDRGVDILNEGGWVHMFPEGYVNMSRQARVRRFKWGIGRLLLEALSEDAASTTSSGADASAAASSDLPVVIPIWIKGFDALMPEPRDAPRWLPRPGAHVSITFGRPIHDALAPLVRKLRTFAASRDAEESGAVQARLDELVAATPTVSKDYPIPSSALFPPITPLAPPPDGAVEWPGSLPDSRSARAIGQGMDSAHARAARALIAAELRAHLVQVGKESGESLDLVHRLMAGEEN